ncbi:50S ribosomal protein L35 [Candidatus Saccharibacteria bacterium]|nr:50S ribosomal protein L35 [Candidatus Saccharibacteria bacterium]
MPKRKTHSGAAKRIKISGGGKLLRRRPSGNHFLQKKSSSRKRGFKIEHEVHPSDTKRIKRQLGV